MSHIEFNAISARSLKSLREESEQDVLESTSHGLAPPAVGQRITVEEATDGNEPSAFVVACRHGWLSARHFFLRHAAIRTFLRAVKEGNTTDALQCLANNPFLLTYRSFAKDGDSVWHLLAEYGDIMLLQAFTNYCKIHDVKHIAPQTSRSRKRAGSRSEKELTISALVNVGNKLRQTPLMFAAYHGRAEVVTFLLKQGANPWAADRCGKRTALHYACIKGHAACAHALLEGIKPEDEKRGGIRYVDVPSASGFTSLHFAVASNCVPAAIVLLSFDAHIDDFNIFDAGEFWISCTMRSTPLHIAAISNRLHCAMAILQYYVQNHQRLKLGDPRTWCDKKGNTPAAIAHAKGFDDLASVLLPGAHLPKHMTQADFDVQPVKKLQVIAAQMVKAKLLASIQEAEEFMKLLGTYQQHGRVFARLAYTSDDQGQQSQQAASSNGPEFGDRRDMHAVPSTPQLPAWSRTPAFGQGPSTSNSIGQGHSGGIPKVSMKKNSSRDDLVSIGTRPAVDARAASGSLRGLDVGLSIGLGKASELSGGPPSSGASAGQPAGKDRKQAAIKQWLSYERKAVAAGKRPARRAPLKERSALSQINPNDAEGQWMAGCMAFLRLRPRAVFLPPQAGEDVCGLCHDNKPGLAMESCGHRTCLLCAKSLCYLLDMQQLVLCPFCGSLVTSFGLG